MEFQGKKFKINWFLHRLLLLMFFSVILICVNLDKTVYLVNTDRYAIVQGKVSNVGKDGWTGVLDMATIKYTFNNEKVKVTKYWVTPILYGYWKPEKGESLSLYVNKLTGDDVLYNLNIWRCPYNIFYAVVLGLWVFTFLVQIARGIKYKIGMHRKKRVQKERKALRKQQKKEMRLKHKQLSKK